jgi:hypothetical protein
MALLPAIKVQLRRTTMCALRAVSGLCRQGKWLERGRMVENPPDFGGGLVDHVARKMEAVDLRYL